MHASLVMIGLWIQTDFYCYRKLIFHYVTDSLLLCIPEHSWFRSIASRLELLSEKIWSFSAIMFYWEWLLLQSSPSLPQMEHCEQMAVWDYWCWSWEFLWQAEKFVWSTDLLRIDINEMYVQGWHWCNIFISWITGTGGSILTPSILKACYLQARQIVGIGSTCRNACHCCITGESRQSYLWVHDKTISSAGRSPVVNLKALNINTSTVVSNSNVETIKVAWGNEGKGCSICSLCKPIWLLKVLYELIVAGGPRCCVIPSIPLIVIHVNIELITGRILSQSAFSKTSTDINEYLSGLEVTDVLCENPVILWCALSEITYPCLICAEATQGTRPLQHKKRNKTNTLVWSSRRAKCPFSKKDFHAENIPTVTTASESTAYWLNTHDSEFCAIHSTHRELSVLISKIYIISCQKQEISTIRF